jgi:hypothetical protein
VFSSVDATDIQQRGYEQIGNLMRQRARKLIGTATLFTFVIFWALLSVSLGSSRISELSSITQGVIIVFLGLVWVIPAALLIRWMSQPDSNA